MSVTVHDQPTETFTRYAMYFTAPDSPVLTNIDGMINNFDNENVVAIRLITADPNETVLISVNEEEDGSWTVYANSLGGPDDGQILEEILYSDNGQDVLVHNVYVAGFSTNDMPALAAA